MCITTACTTQANVLRKTRKLVFLLATARGPVVLFPQSAVEEGFGVE